jgi:hypothetical protein
MALAACLLGYGEVGLWLMREAKQPQSRVRIDDNPYSQWIEDYAGERYQAAVKVGIGAPCVMSLRGGCRRVIMVSLRENRGARRP